MDFLALWPCSKHGQERSMLAAASEANLYQNSQAQGILIGGSLHLLCPPWERHAYPAVASSLNM